LENLLPSVTPKGIFTLLRRCDPNYRSSLWELSIPAENPVDLHLQNNPQEVTIRQQVNDIQSYILANRTVRLKDDLTLDITHVFCGGDAANYTSKMGLTLNWL
jgi:hypothetical protein